MKSKNTFAHDYQTLTTHPEVKDLYQTSQKREFFYRESLHVEPGSTWIEISRAICWQFRQCVGRAQMKVKAVVGVKSVLTGPINWGWNVCIEQLLTRK